MQSSRTEPTTPVPDRIQVALSLFVTVCFALLAVCAAWVAAYSTLDIGRRLLAAVAVALSLVCVRSSVIIAAREIQIHRSDR